MIAKQGAAGELPIWRQPSARDKIPLPYDGSDANAVDRIFRQKNLDDRNDLESPLEAAAQKSWSVRVGEHAAIGCAGSPNRSLRRVGKVDRVRPAHPHLPLVRALLRAVDLRKCVALRIASSRRRCAAICLRPAVERTQTGQQRCCRESPQRRPPKIRRIVTLRALTCGGGRVLLPNLICEITATSELRFRAFRRGSNDCYDRQSLLLVLVNDRSWGIWRFRKRDKLRSPATCGLQKRQRG